MKGAQHTVLLVDDEPEVLDSLRRILRAEDYRILSTTSPLEALAIMEGGGYAPEGEHIVGRRAAG